MDYVFKNLTLTTECSWYVVIPADLETPTVSECSGVLKIFYPRSEMPYGRVLSKFQQIYFTYSGYKFRLKSLDPITITIVQISDLPEDKILVTDSIITILAKELTPELLIRVLTEKYFELVEEGSEFKYYELLTLLLNKTTDVKDLSLYTTPISLIDTKDRYLLSFTQVMDAVYTKLSEEISKYKFAITTENQTEDVNSREYAVLGFNSYFDEYFRLQPQWDNEFTEYKIPLKVTLNTTSVSKFERLLNEIKTLKFLTNVTKVICQDSLGRPWNIAINWKEIEVPDPVKPENNKGEVAYFIIANFEITYYAVRNNKYPSVKEFLIQILNKDSNE